MQDSTQRHRPFQSGDAKRFRKKKIQNPEVAIYKQDIIDAVTKRIEGLSGEQVRAVINESLDMITDSLAAGCRVRFEGFGSCIKCQNRISIRTGSKVKRKFRDAGNKT
tara:strand:- start:116 stop:439 length:324 start_codon:yes stop_codon:yes gene_type:complete